jgi:TRAP-type C4-dicarboxylate transport system permease small subunit
MKTLARAYDALLYGMAILAGALMVAVMVTIVVDVALRNLGTQSSAHLFTFTEYALLLIPCLGAPWLVRERGHVFVEIGLTALSREKRVIALRLLGILCVAVCMVIAWYGLQVTIRSYVLDDKDVRSFDMPRWMLVAFIPLSFAMMAGEFLRFLRRGENPLGSMMSGLAQDEERS